MTSRHRTSRRPKQPTRRAWLPAFVVPPALLGAAAVSPATIQSSASGDGVSRLFAARVATPIRPLVDPMVERVRSEAPIRIDARTRLADFEVLEEFRQLAAPRRQGGSVRSGLGTAVFSVHPNGNHMLRWRDRRGYLVWLRGYRRGQPASTG